MLPQIDIIVIEERGFQKFSTYKNLLQMRHLYLVINIDKRINMNFAFALMAQSNWAKIEWEFWSSVEPDGVYGSGSVDSLLRVKLIQCSNEAFWILVTNCFHRCDLLPFLVEKYNTRWAK